MSTAGTEAPTADDDESIADAVVQAVAAHEDIAPTALTPALYDVIDPDALNALFAPTDADGTRTTGRVVFSYCGYEVTAYSDGRVTVEETTSPDHSTPSESASRTE